MKIFIVVFSSLLLFATQAKVTNLSHDQYLKVNELIKEIRISDKESPILLVSDFDNTLMKPLNILGSDQFYEWQAHLIKTDSPKKDFADFDEFMNTHQKAMMLTNMAPTDPEIPSFLKNLEDKNVKMFILTSRGPIFRSITERDLDKFAMPVKKLSPFPGFIYEGKLNEREVHFQNGIFFTSGLNKGEALFFLLNLNQANFTHVIFIDDMEKHTIAMTEYLQKNPELDKKINIYNIRYSKEDDAKANFLKNEKKAKKEIKQFKQFLKKHFP